jgi:hypothetical protein
LIAATFRTMSTTSAANMRPTSARPLAASRWSATATTPH